MISDFIDERNEHLQLSDEEFSRAKEKDPTIRKLALDISKMNVNPGGKQLVRWWWG